MNEYVFISLLMTILKPVLFACISLAIGIFKVHAASFVLHSGKSFSLPISQDNLLKGLSFHSNLDLQAGDLFKLTDGEGSKPDGSFRTFARDDIKDWVVTFSRLKIIRLEEVRVFSWNGDQRAQQDYDLAYPFRMAH